MNAKWLVRIGRRERRVRNDGAVEGDRRRHAVDLELGQRAPATARSACWRVAPVTMSLASSESKFCPMTLPCSTPASTRTPGPDGGLPHGHRPGRREEAASGVLAVDPELERVTAAPGSS